MTVFVGSGEVGEGVEPGAALGRAVAEAAGVQAVRIVMDKISTIKMRFMNISYSKMMACSHRTLPEKDVQDSRHLFFV